jgi:hypothetical protein
MLLRLLDAQLFRTSYQRIMGEGTKDEVLEPSSSSCNTDTCSLDCCDSTMQSSNVVVQLTNWVCTSSQLAFSLYPGCCLTLVHMGGVYQ